MASVDKDVRWESSSGGRHPLRYVAAAALAVPVGAIVWFELVYLLFGLTGEEPQPAVNVTAFIVAFGLAFVWPLYRTRRPLEVVKRSCGLGTIVAMLLPVVAVTVLLLWQQAQGRRDLGMGGLMLYSLPLVAFGLALVLVVLFGIGNKMATRRLERSPVQKRS